MAKQIFLDQAIHSLLIAQFYMTKDGMMYNHFDCSMVNGSESRNLPVLSEYISVYADLWKLLRDCSALVEKDAKDIAKKTSAFVAVDGKLGSS